MESKLRRMRITPPDLDGNVVMNLGATRQQLPNELLLFLSKYLRDEDCVSLALSGAVKGFASFYRLNRKHVISSRCFFLSPSSWSVYFNQHIIPATVTTFNVNHLYWLPGDLLADAIIQMKSLKKLGVKDTKVSLSLLANILNVCLEITHLDFSFCFEEDWKNLQAGLKKVILDSMAANFKRLTCFKVSTCVDDARDYRHDPWQPILQFLSMCRDCVDLSVEITYTGEPFDYPASTPWVHPLFKFTDLCRFIKETIYPHLGWMKSLKSLVLTKLGPFHTASEDRGYVYSLMLNELLDWLFSEEGAPRSLQHLWIQNFCCRSIRSLEFCASSLKTCQVGEVGRKFNYDSFPNLEILAEIDLSHEFPLLHLPNLKYAYGICYFDESDFNDFVRTHPNLEYLTVEYIESEVTLNQRWKLPKLKVLNYLRDSIDKEIIESLVEVYPNVESLYLYNRDDSNTISEDQECLSSINFPNLTSLSLKHFKIHDGAFFLPMIQKCPKLQRLNVFDIPSVEPTFIMNLDSFLPLAINLRDVRMEFTKFDGSQLLPLLKSFFKHSPQLERLSLLDEDCDDSSSEWGSLEDPSELSDYIVKFALELPHLVALCISFYHPDREFGFDLTNQVDQRVTEEVLPSKPSFWFHLGWEDRPMPSFTSVPLIHYQDMVSPNPPWNPPKIELLN